MGNRKSCQDHGRFNQVQFDKTKTAGNSVLEFVIQFICTTETTKILLRSLVPPFCLTLLHQVHHFTWHDSGCCSVALPTWNGDSKQSRRSTVTLQKLIWRLLGWSSWPGWPLSAQRQNKTHQKGQSLQASSQSKWRAPAISTMTEGICRSCRGEMTGFHGEMCKTSYGHAGKDMSMWLASTSSIHKRIVQPSPCRAASTSYRPPTCSKKILSKKGTHEAEVPRVFFLLDHKHTAKSGKICQLQLNKVKSMSGRVTTYEVSSTVRAMWPLWMLNITPTSKGLRSARWRIPQPNPLRLSWWHRWHRCSCFVQPCAEVFPSNSLTNLPRSMCPLKSFRDEWRHDGLGLKVTLPDTNIWNSAFQQVNQGSQGRLASACRYLVSRS